ncbi:ABC transporter, partial [Methanosalsum natronophilum]
KLISVITLTPIESSLFGFVMSMGPLLLLPLMLHVSATAIVGIGLYYLGHRYYLVLLLAATFVHSFYNIYLLRGILVG